MLKLNDKQKEIVINILKKYVADQKVLVFGSRVNEKVKIFSDLDLCIMTQKPLSLSMIAQMREDFSESDLPFRVDIADWANTNEEFRQEILRNSKVLIDPTQSN